MKKCKLILSAIFSILAFIYWGMTVILSCIFDLAYKLFEKE
jgi:hypothetical protein